LNFRLRASELSPAAVALAFAAMLVSRFGFVPYWDAKGYYDCIAHASTSLLELQNYRCFGHTTITYLIPLVLSQAIAPYTVAGAYAINALLGTGSIVAFHTLLRLLFPGRSWIEYALVTALYALAPLFLVHALFFNLDYGMTVFFVPFLYFLLARRMWPATFLGIAVVLSKDTGAAVFAAAVVAYGVMRLAVVRRSAADLLAEARLHAPLLLVPTALVVYVVVFELTQPNPGPWLTAYAQVGMLHDPLAAISFNPADPGIRSLLADLFVLNFQWIYSIVLAIAAILWLTTFATGRRRAGSADANAWLLVLLLAELVYLVTRYRDYNNARYVLVASPVLVALFYGALTSVAAKAVIRRTILAVAVVLVTLSNFRTIDPISKAVFGTFSVGSRALLDMPSLLKGPRMDATVYNLEALDLARALEDLMQDMRPAPNTVLFMGDTTYNFPPNVDARTYRLTVDPSGALPLVVLSLDGDIQRNALGTRLGEGDRFFYMALPNADNHQLRLLLGEYPVAARKRYDHDGYIVDLYTFRYAPRQ
jgi:hypothetical protein